MRLHNRHNVALVFGAALFVAGSLSVARAQSARPLPQPPPGVSIERGKYLVTAQDCNGCHTPFKNGEPDMTRMLSGHPASEKITGKPPMAAGWSTAISDTNTAWAGPWGVSFPTNLTPDRGTGIGTWTEQTFIATIRNGKKGGTGRALLPPMPWRMYGQLSDDDLKSIFMYLKSIPAIANQVPNAILAPPAR
jgi:mono/diheme cytochrome c family protein